MNDNNQQIPNQTPEQFSQEEDTVIDNQDVVPEQQAVEASPVQGISDSSPENPFIEKQKMQAVQREEHAYVEATPRSESFMIHLQSADKPNDDLEIVKALEHQIEISTSHVQKQVEETVEQTQQKLNQEILQNQQALDETVSKLEEQANKLQAAVPIIGLINPQAAQTIQQSTKFLNKAVLQGQRASTDIDVGRDSLNNKIAETKAMMANQNTDPNTNLALESAIPLITTMRKSEQRKLLTQAGLERKTEQFTALRSWELYREGVMTQHKKIIEDVFQRIEKRVEVSEHSINKIVKYYQQRCEFEEACSKFYREQNNLGKLFKEKDDKITYVYYPGFTQTLTSVDECNKDQSKQIDLFIVHLRNQIKDVFEMERENYNKVFREIKEAYVRQFKRVSDSVTAVHKYYGKYCKYYNEALTLHVKQKSSSKDMYNKEMKYKQATSNLLHDQCQLGALVVDRWQIMLRLESQRLNIIKKALIDFQRNHISVYGKTEILRIIQNLLDEIKPIEEVEASWSIRSILKQAEQDAIKLVLQTSQLTIDEVKVYFGKLPLIEEQRSHPLVLKHFRCYRDVGHVGKSWKEVDLIVTIDYNGRIIFKGLQEKIIKQAIIRFGAAGTKLKPREVEKHDRYMVDLSYQKPGLLLDSSKKLLLKFNTSDEIEELDFCLGTVKA